ncbi:SDR family NAD(P)-dependent oxidoreductase [Pasteurella atlantica]|uniref:SDR family NAD(P)-dependent oxidoreductase n=1 Tax=Pasteurellaceae TaxID=712 RepID=UPI00277B42DF|nr:SDR family oxidoreductase [Pasteurella atlantica]MDP8098923.1 SDR family oxidoreductase [Pasteurella atlantica]MDP8106950.1 SDR family oxidoreductase [Pasteurella atlantica]MDP8116640.1 SDR family oxidoreductase [Pasteurella atlantica]
MMELSNKIIVITGASTGIGKQLALRLAKEKCQLALIARNEKQLVEVVKQAKELGAVNANYYICDICDTEKLELTLQSIVSDFGTVDVLINNAGIWQKLMPVDEMDVKMVDDIIQTNLLAVIHTTRLLLPVLRQREEARIINIVSKSGVVAQQNQSVYTASKYGIRGFTEVLKQDLAETNIKIAGVYQSGTNTEMFAKSGDNFDTQNFTNPEDLADVIAYMLSQPDKIWLHDVRVGK